MRNKPNGPNGMPESAPARMPGGAPGVPPQSSGQVLSDPARTFKQLEPRVGPKVRRYRVRNGGAFMMGSVRVTLRAGKEITDTNYDVAMLKRNGILLDEVREDEGAPVPTAQ